MLNTEGLLHYNIFSESVLVFYKAKVSSSRTYTQISVRDVTWMSDQSVHLSALEQVTVSHLAKCPKSSEVCQISDLGERHLYECHGVALSQVITHTGFTKFMNSMSSTNIGLNDVCHEKTDLKVFVVVIPKEVKRSQKTQILKSRCHTKRRMGARGRAHPSFGMTPTF